MQTIALLFPHYSLLSGLKANSGELKPDLKSCINFFLNILVQVWLSHVPLATRKLKKDQNFPIHKTVNSVTLFLV